MVDIGTSGGVLVKAGINVDTAVSGAWLNNMIDEAEATINAISRKDWTTSYSGGIANHQLLREGVENLAAISAISYNMLSNGQTRIEAEDKINILWARYQVISELIQDQKVVDFIG